MASRRYESEPEPDPDATPPDPPPDEPAHEAEPQPWREQMRDAGQVSDPDVGDQPDEPDAAAAPDDG